MSAPNFLIIGERRSGSTALAYWLQQHPQIFVAPRMDTAHFIEQEVVAVRKKGGTQKSPTAWQFIPHAYTQLFEQAKSEQIAIGEKSADYLFWKSAHSRIHQYFPEIKLIVILRDPIQRAWSMYWNERGKGREHEDFGIAIRRPKNDDKYDLMHRSYLARGKYATSLKRLWETFRRDQVLVLILEEIVANSQKSWERINAFLGPFNSPMPMPFKLVNKNRQLLQRPFVLHSKLLRAIDKGQYWLVKRIAHRVSRGDLFLKHQLLRWGSHPWRVDRTSQAIPSEDRNWLKEYYREDRQALETLLGKKIDCWQ